MTISSGKAFWRANVDIYVLDIDGSVLDASLLGAVAALSSLKALPQVIMDDSGVSFEQANAHMTNSIISTGPILLLFM